MLPLRRLLDEAGSRRCYTLLGGRRWMGLWGQAIGVPAIEVVDLGKRYRIGAQRGAYRSYDTLRDALATTAGLIGRRVWRRAVSRTTSEGQERTLWAP